jgi:acyl-CoA dehydrogenase
MASYAMEPIDELAFSAPHKARRYDTDRYQGAEGLNWFSTDPSLQLVLERYLGKEALQWAKPKLEAIGALIGTRIERLAQETDKNPPRLERYDRWGHETSQIVFPPSFLEARDLLVRNSFTSPEFIKEALDAGADATALGVTWNYLLSQADIGMVCALGTGGDMVVELAEAFAPEEVKAKVREIFSQGMFSGEAAQLLTERTGGSDLGALEATASPDGDAWRLDGLKWFASNAGGSAFVVLAKPIGAPDSVAGIAPFLVLKERRDGSRNGVVIRRLKDKLGTRSVASAEVEFRAAEAFILAPNPFGTSPTRGSSELTKGGLARMMQLTNGARLAIAVMGIGCARRALVESLCYASAREAFGDVLVNKPLMRRMLASLIVELEAAQLLVFEGYLGKPRLRLMPALSKLRAARLGVNAASTAIEVHGGNGYVETWPVARILRDAQVNPIWEGGENILYLDVRRSMLKEQAHVPYLERMRGALATAATELTETADLVSRRLDHLEQACAAWLALAEQEPQSAEALLVDLAQEMIDVAAAALLIEQATWEEKEVGSSRKAIVARSYARSHLGSDPRNLAMTGLPEEVARFKELMDGAFSWNPANR